MIHAEINEDPPCKTCLPPLLPENQIVYAIYSRVCGQHIMGSAGPVDLLLEPIFKIMELFKVDKEDQLFYIDMIQRAYHNMLEVRRERRKGK